MFRGVRWVDPMLELGCNHWPMNESSTRQSSGSTDSLAVLRSLCADLEDLKGLGDHLAYIDEVVFESLRNDQHADGLRGSLKAFDRFGHIFLSQLDEALSCATSFYTSLSRTSSIQTFTRMETNAQSRYVLELFNSRNQRLLAKKTVTALELAQRLVQTQVFPLLPALRKRIETYSNEFKGRCNATRERERSWLPIAIQDLIWDKPQSVQSRKLADVELLFSDFETSYRLLHLFPILCERLSAHFVHISGLNSDQLEGVDTSIEGDLLQLYINREEARMLLQRMYQMMAPMERAFRRGSLDDLG
ncbi:hypothetical protein PIIN_05202 [Serendipita indica DSM 11827]|uniref:Uncharacterized protein n=1 Tax=Serendipita indica (strain DSM 11827) TaxID=1109443 RepID=G4TIX4_SERID|nr:hypothetical protein PIIN_05202 [Serendipita indica DSM 11827]